MIHQDALSKNEGQNFIRLKLNQVELQKEIVENCKKLKIDKKRQITSGGVVAAGLESGRHKVQLDPAIIQIAKVIKRVSSAEHVKNLSEHQSLFIFNSFKLLSRLNEKDVSLFSVFVHWMKVLSKIPID